MKTHILAHFRLITHHRHLVIRHAAKMGIFFYSLHHDLSKYSFQEFFPSQKYYQGNRSPIPFQRKENGGFSDIALHHAKKNKHHWEYYVDFSKGKMLVKTFPYKDAVEFVCDVIAASKTYNKKKFQKNMPLDYFLKVEEYCYMTEASREFFVWCFTQYSNSGFKNLKKKKTKEKYSEFVKNYPNIVSYDLKKSEDSL